MPVKVNVETNIDVKELTVAIDNLMKKVDDFVESQKEALVATKEAAEASKKASEAAATGSEKLAKGFKGVGLAIKSAGLFLWVEALRLLRQLFLGNQEVADAFAVVMEFIGRIFNDLVNLVVDKGKDLISFFSDPKKAAQDLVDLIKNNIMVRINAFIEQWKLLGSIIKKVFKGDWEGAGKDAIKAGKLYADVLTGVENTVDKLASGTQELWKQTKEYVTEVGKAAAGTVEFNKQLKLLVATTASQVAEYDRLITRQERIIANERKTVEERRNAFIELQRLRKLRAQEQKELAEQELEAAERQLQKDKDNIDYQIQQIQALSKVRAADFELQMAELQTVEEFEAFMEGQRIERMESGFERMQRRHEEEFDAEKSQNERMEEIRKENLKAREALDRKMENLDKKRMKREKFIADSISSIYSDMFGALGILAEDNAEHAKIVAAAEATISTLLSITKTLAAYSAVPVPGLAIAQAVATGVFGFLQVRKILQTQINSPQVSLNSGSTAPATTALPAVEDPFNPILPDLQGEQNFGGPNAPPVKVVVVATDIEEELALLNTIRDRSRI